jgi:hypothetical protein
MIFEAKRLNMALDVAVAKLMQFTMCRFGPSASSPRSERDQAPP